jgi:hypothetical protein
MQDHLPSSASPSPAHDSETWQVYWKEQGQPWRSEPLIDEERQQHLASCARESVDIEQGKYPFKGVRLNRADVEWLLAAEEQRSAQVSMGGDSSRKPLPGLDVRGADLSGVDLSGLPLMRLHAGLSLEEGRHATVEQSRQAAANLAKADVSYAQLQGSQLGWATLDETVLVEAHLEGADLGKATLKQGTHCEGKALGRDERERLRAWMPHFPQILPAADLRGVFLTTRTNLGGIHAGNDQYGYVALADIHWGDVNLTVVDWTKLKRLSDETLARPLTVEDEDGAQTGERGLPASAERAIDKLLRAQEISDVVVSYVMRSPALTKSFRERLAREAQAQPETQQQRERERLQAAVRANRQLAVVLRAQGLNEAADRFAYRAQVLQRQVLRRSGVRSLRSYFFSCVLDVLAGYGYKPGRTLIAYLVTILSFAIIYNVLGHLAGFQPSMSPLYALVVSIISFHGRGFFPGGFLPTLPMAVCAACEAIIGLTIEISFIATFTQRYYGK